MPERESDLLRVTEQFGLQNRRRARVSGTASRALSPALPLPSRWARCSFSCSHSAVLRPSMPLPALGSGHILLSLSALTVSYLRAETPAVPGMEKGLHTPHTGAPHKAD